MPIHFQASFFDLPNLSLNNHTHNICAQIPCIHMQRPHDQKIIYAHLLDTPGIPIPDTGLFDRDSILLALVTYFAMGTSENSLILPFFEKVFENDLTFIQELKITLTSLNEKLQKYFYDMFEALCLCFDPSELTECLNYTTKFKRNNNKTNSERNMTPLSQHLNPLIDKEPLLSNFNGPICSYCSMAKEPTSQNLQMAREDKTNNVYSKCCMTLVLPMTPSPTPYDLNEAFSDRFLNLRSLSCTGKVVFENEKKFFKKFKKLQRLELSNNGLNSVPQSIPKLKSLKYLAIRNNEISFKKVIASFRRLSDLTTLKLENLEFDLDKDKPVKIPKSLTKLCKF